MSLSVCQEICVCQKCQDFGNVRFWQHWQSRSISPRVVTILSTPFRESCADEFEEPIQGCTEAVKEEVSICGESIQWWSIESDS